MRGFLKVSIIAFIEEPTLGKNTINIAKQICRIVASKRYGMSAAQVFQKLSAMTVDEAMDWVESIWGKYINEDDMVSIIERSREGDGRNA